MHIIKMQVLHSFNDKVTVRPTLFYCRLLWLEHPTVPFRALRYTQPKWYHSPTLLLPFHYSTVVLSTGEWSAVKESALV
jgi:hypothetical protein